MRRRSTSRRSGTDASDRGVSDLVGFVLTFSMVVLMVGLVYTAGLAEIQAMQNAEHATNAERAFDVLGDNVDDLVHQGAPSRATSITLSGSEIRFGDPVTFQVNFTGTGAPPYNMTTDPIVYATGDGTAIVYVNGAVIRDQRAGAVMVREPPFVFGSRTVVPYIVTRGIGSSRGGETTVLVRTTLASRQAFARRPTVTDDVVLTIDSSRAAVWARYVESEVGADVCTDPGSGETVCTLSASRAYVSLAKVDVRLI